MPSLKKTVVAEQKPTPRPAVVKTTPAKDEFMKTKNVGDSRNIIEQYAKSGAKDVFMEVPENGFMLKRADDSYEAVIRFNFQTLQNFKQTGFGSYYLDSSKFLGLIAIILNGVFNHRCKEYKASKENFPKPVFEDEKPVKNSDKYRYFAIFPGKKAGLIMVRYIERDTKTNKQTLNVQIPFEEDIFYGKMMKIYQEMQKK